MRLLNGIGKVLGCRAWLLAIMTLIVAGALNIQSCESCWWQADEENSALQDMPLHDG